MFSVQVTSKDLAGKDGQSNMNVFCRLCCVGENEGSERARKMLCCKSCGKKYHRNCLKNWAQNRGTISWLEVVLLQANVFLILGFYLLICFTGVHGSALLAVFVRYTVTNITSQLPLYFFGVYDQTSPFPSWRY